MWCLFLQVSWRISDVTYLWMGAFDSSVRKAWPAECINKINCCLCQGDYQLCLEADMIPSLVENHGDPFPCFIVVIIVHWWLMPVEIGQFIYSGLKAFHSLLRSCGSRSCVNHMKESLCLLRRHDHICLLIHLIQFVLSFLTKRWKRSCDTLDAFQHGLHLYCTPFN